MAGRNVSVLILHNFAGKILLQHRTEDAPRFPGYWGFFGGGIELGETPEQALAREAVEELSYRTENPHLLSTHKISFQGEDYYVHVFVEKYDNQPLVLGEGQGMEWFSPEETKELKIVDHERKIIEEVREYLHTL